MSSLGRYELLEPIGSGGMAKVFLGRARGLHGFERMVAVKVCHPHLRDDAAFATRFLDEAKIAAKIRHPNVVATLDCGDEAGSLYLVMDWIEGDRLAGLLEKGPLSPEVAARIMADALAGLQAAHDLGNIHRDVSPQNILVGVDGVTRIADFGLAKALGASTISRDGEMRGKVAYMAPEQIMGGTIGASIDVWAAGVVLWESLTGERLFARETEAETINAVLRWEARPVGHERLDAVIARALRRAPTERWASAHDMQLALEEAVTLPQPRVVSEVVRGETRVTTSRQAPIEKLVEKPVETRRSRWPIALALLTAFALGAGALYLRHTPPAEVAAPSAPEKPVPPPAPSAAPELEELPTPVAISPSSKPSASPRPHFAKKPAAMPKPASSGYFPKEP